MFKRGKLARVVWLCLHAGAVESGALAELVAAECVRTRLEPEVRRYHSLGLRDLGRNWRRSVHPCKREQQAAGIDDRDRDLDAQLRRLFVGAHDEVLRVGERQVHLWPSLPRAYRYDR